MSNWFTDARFGMFVHWGLYSCAGGCWKGMETPWVSEWMMCKFQIPREEYKSLCSSFTAEKFDAERWMRTIADAGMKYMVITSKHHDGFAMFDSSYDDYNVVKMTPFGRDPLKELAEAARKYGIKLGFYYSHVLDWNEPGAVGNTWDFPAEAKTDEAFEAYLNGKVKHQLKELLTNYGDVALIWFDMPVRITVDQARDLRRYVRELAPDCLVNGRLTYKEKWDFDSLGDNILPHEKCTFPAEGCGTMNESWGYKPSDRYYRTLPEILNTMGSLVSNNANYLLNVGPDGTGAFPAEACTLLKGTGEFLRKNGEALYGCSGLPMTTIAHRWGTVTCRGENAYFWCFKNPGKLAFYGIRNEVESAEIIGGPKVAFEQFSREEYDFHRLTLEIPQTETPFVVKVRCKGNIECDQHAYGASSKG
jgi:alpha-L-fucosidase